MAAPNIKEIEWAISELENQESSKGSYTLLAALYICRNQMLGNMQKDASVSAYSSMSSPISSSLDLYGDSDFLRTVSGKDPAEAWAVIDELMNTLKVVNPRAYDNVMRKLQNL